MDDAQELTAFQDLCAITYLPNTNHAAPSATARPAFEYETERLKPQEIRLIRILPGDNSCIVNLEIQRVFLENRLRYTALSYTWGSPPATCLLGINRRSHYVRKNLWRFLHQRRKQGQISEWLWIDALCINQEDPKERTQQVDMMAYIYANAERVLVWLGPEYRDSGQAIQALARGEKYWQAERRLLNVWGKPTGDKIASLCSRQYWTRLWIFQELMLAKEIIVLCGGMQLQWRDLEQFLLATNTISPLPQQMRRLAYQAIVESPALSLVKERQYTKSAATVWELIRNTQHLKCSEVRDKVFGVLGVLPAQHQISADYSIPVPTLLNMVLREHHKLRRPESLETVAEQCEQLAKIVGIDVSAMFDLSGQRGQFVTPKDTDMEAFPLRHQRSSISLWWASFYGYDAVQGLLFAGNILNGDKELVEAVKAGNEAVVTLLMNTNRIDGDIKEELYGVLLWAATSGYKREAKALLATNKVDPDLKDQDQRTPLSLAAKGGHKGVLKALLATKKVEPDSKESNGRTPLSLAAAGGYKKVVKALLATGKVNPDSRDGKDRTPLWWAAEGGHEEVVKELLDKWKVEPDSHDSIRRTPLSLAAAGGHEGVVKALLATGKVNPDSRDMNDRTPLWWAAKGGHEEVVKELLDIWKVGADSHDSIRRTPLSLAAAGGHEGVVKALLATGKAKPDLRDMKGRTPLQWAIKGGHEGVVKALKQDV